MSAQQPGLLSSYETTVDAAWIDYNGHMSEPYYVLVFGYATDAAMESLGLGEDYRAASGCSLYTVEAHVRYLQEVSLGEPLSVRTVLAGFGAKKLHLAHELYRSGQLVATEEILGLHVDQAAGATVPFGPGMLSAARRAAADPPPWCGRRIG
ncbi:4-hydroxybenzoyl-CoA thioesterase [Arthrobacter sp. MYb224]|uniref:thioesterase family protein n=1 Tax=Arthrobacter sp. MYb224 TaxID=1848600 RepID=UPI000CFB8D0E|nr:thioesterase family protein [Arthrobacter sp. MYb224]PQZ97097.1 4-hydroxybenzoyl-CoA thioesterase [Arthrobacter sp. MYb224]